MIRVGVMGAGWVANHRHLPILRSSKDVEVVAVYDRNIERAKASARAHRVSLATDDLEEFFSASPEAVSVCSSPWAHHELTLAALDHRCHVLTEKPMAMNTEEAQRMATAAEAAGRVLCVSHNFIFSTAVRHTDMALEGAGEVRYVMGTQLSSDHRRLPTWFEDLPCGLLFDELPHLLYMMQHYLGRLALDSVRVSSRTEKGHPATTEILVRGERGPGQAMIVSGAPVSEWHVAVIASDRVIDLDLFRDIAVEIPTDGRHSAANILRTSITAVAGHLWGFAKSGARLTTRRLFWGHDVLIRRFLDAAQGNGDSPVTVADALSIVALTDEIMAALSNG